MTTDLTSLIQNLRDLYAAGVLDADQYAAGLNKLRAARGAAAIDAAIQVLDTPNSSNGNTPVDALSPGKTGTSVPAGQSIHSRGGDVAGLNMDKRTVYEAQVQNFYHTVGTPEPSVEQRELLISYLDELVRRCDRMRLTGIVDWGRKHGKAPPFTLSQLYIALASTTWQMVAEAESADEFAAAIAAGHPDTILPWDTRRLGEVILDMGLAGGRSPVRYRLERPVLLTEVLSRQRHVVLLGGPGSGKSTFLRHLAVALARTTTEQDTDAHLPGWEAGVVLPIYASLGAYAAWSTDAPERLTIDGLWRFLLLQSEGTMLEGLASQFRVAFRQGRLLLLLDGLDEVAHLALRTQVAAIVASLADSPGYVAVTCRVRSFDGAVADPFDSWADPVQLAPFTLGQIRHFVQGWYQHGVEQNTISTALARQRSNELSERIATLKELRDLAETPLLLTIITILHYYDGKLPDDRADLYEDMAQLLLTRWTLQRRDTGTGPSLTDQLRKLEPRLSGLNDYQIRGVLEHLAYRAHQAERIPDSRGLLERGIVREAFLKLFTNFNLGEDQDGAAGRCAALVLHYLEEESGLLLHEGGDLYGLPHLTYEEYLAACYLAKQKGKPNFQTLAYQHWRSDPGRWREVIFLALGRMVRGDDRDIAADWIDFLLLERHGHQKRDPHELQQAALFAGDCLREIGGKDKLSNASSVDLPDLWQRLSLSMAEIVEGALLPVAERVRAGILLGDLGDPRPGVCDLNTIPWVAFTGGPCIIGNPPAQAEYDDEQNTDPINVAAFALARYPVTNAQYRLFIEAGGYNPKADWWDAAGREWLQSEPRTESGNWRDKRVGSMCPNHPVVGISWYEATAFAKWLTAQLNDGTTYCLPSELEWEYAARGSQRRIYPWGNAEPDAERANYDEKYNGTSPVGCFASGATPEGLFDMAGNVWTWTRSEYRTYPYNPHDKREDGTDPERKRFTLRGGGWVNPALFLRSSSRLYDKPNTHSFNVGFRLARHSV